MQELKPIHKTGHSREGREFQADMKSPPPTPWRSSPSSSSPHQLRPIRLPQRISVHEQGVDDGLGERVKGARLGAERVDISG